jgi:NitT/TauT family transport system substrate-binding protein
VAVTRKSLEENPERVRKFVAATIRGWEKYLQSPEATNKEINRINPDMDLDSLAQAAVAIRPLCVMKDGQPYGSMTSARWTELAEQMASVKAIRGDTQAAADAAWKDIIGDSTLTTSDSQ